MILEVKDLVVQFKTDRGRVNAVKGVTFSVHKGKSIGIVGESGSGKSVTALSIMGLIPSPPGKVVGGTIKYRGDDLLEMSERKMRVIRGNKIAMIFQEPMTSLNPVFTCGNQILEVFQLHRPEFTKKQMKEEAINMLRLVGIPSPERRYGEYPHQLSGGMRQRVMIAMALACKPDILICDEPTTALDVTIQAQILELMNKLRVELGMGIIMITHDLGVVAETCHDVSVMYCGKIVESGTVEKIFENPQHPYTKGLIGSIPSFDSTAGEAKGRLLTIDGMVPSLFDLPKGCSFQDRCFAVTEECRLSTPKLQEVSENGHSVACYNPLRGQE
ncbi:MAG: ABC transporter ATP-binding protein [Bacteriovoracaceae bacterium]|nr:ABC transporter ATP-binding protein [Bacteriovoracaceae bacterium]